MANETRMLNLAAIKARFRRMPEAMKVAVGTQLAKEVEDLTDAIQRAAPVNDLDEHPGQLKESVHFFPNPDKPLSYRIIADAKDDKGEFIGAHVEHGHKARDGSHVPAVPFFFPTYRAFKRGLKSRVSRAGSKAAQKVVEES